MVQVKNCWTFQTKVMNIYFSEVMVNVNNLYNYNTNYRQHSRKCMLLYQIHTSPLARMYVSANIHYENYIPKVELH